MSKGIDNLLTAIDGVVGFISEAQDALADGVQPSDAFDLIPQLPRIYALRDEIRASWPEIQNLDNQERKQIFDAIREAYDIEDDVLEEVIEEYIDLAQYWIEIIVSVVDAINMSRYIFSNKEVA
jgi:hypothetical protein